MSFKQTDWCLEFAFVVDVSANMANALEKIKKEIPQLVERTCKVFDEGGKPVGRVRAEIVTFTNFQQCELDTLTLTQFYDWNNPQEKQEFLNVLEGLQAKRATLPSCGLEALFQAMNTAWTPLGESDWVSGRHIIYLLTNNLPQQLGAAEGCVGYYSFDFPNSMEEFNDLWNIAEADRFWEFSSNSKRLVLVAPTGTDGERNWWDDVRKWKHVFDGTLADSEEDLFSKLFVGGE